MENLVCYIIRACFSQERMTYIPGESKVAYQSKDGKMVPCCSDVISFKVRAERIITSRHLPEYVECATQRPQKLMVFLNALET